MATNLRQISDDEPGWARTLERALAELHRRIDRAARDMPGGRHYTVRGENMSSTTATEAEERSLQRSPTHPDIDPRLEEGRISLTSSGQRRDELYRRQDAQIHEMRAMMSRMSREPTIEERNQLAVAHQRADSVYAMFGRDTPAWMPGESPLAYRQRLADGLKAASPTLKRAHLAGLRADALGAVEAKIYQDAMEAAKTGSAIPRGELRRHTYQDQSTGHNVTEYYGDPLGWMAPFMSGGVRLTINRNPGKAIQA